MDNDLGATLSLFKNYFNRYDKFVRLNPRVAAEVEAIIRWSSYLIATRKSPIIGELLSSAANLLQLCNDIILRQANSQLKLDLSNCATQLKTFLTVLQSLELLAEIYARETYGATGKWAIITSIQLAKAMIKLVLLLVYDDGISKSQSIVTLDRIHYSEIAKLQEKYNNLKDDNEPTIQEIDSETGKSVVLKSSGRKMRSITEAPPKGSRFMGNTTASDALEPFARLEKQRLKILLNRYRELRPAALTERQLCGELLHITRPLAHLALMGVFGTQSWLSYVTSLAMDVSSLYLVRSPLPIPEHIGQSSTMTADTVPGRYQFNANERQELGQRVSSLLLYLLRSPFFEDYTKQHALEGLASSAQGIPLVGGFLATFFNYIPDWQKDYFRVWAS